MTAPPPLAQPLPFEFNVSLELMASDALVVIVTGDRDWADTALVFEALDGFRIKELHHGGARGADWCAKTWAIRREVPHFEHVADWALLGRSAGPRRNITMHDDAKANLVIAFKDGLGSNPHGGTEHMVSLAWKSKTPVWHVDHDGARWLPRP
jgi:hypothetical protein